jgi:hypothetical protein
MRQLALLVIALSAGCSSGPTGRLAAPSPGGFRAGTAKARITPEKMSWMTGYGGRNKRAERVHDELYARALALEDERGRRVVLVAADILGFSPVLNRAIRREAKARHGLADGDLMLVASHTHGGPSIPQRPSLEVFHGLSDEDAKEIFEYADWLQARVLGVIAGALASLEPVRLSLARTEAHFGVNRRVRQPNGSVRFGEDAKGAKDPDVPVLWVEGGRGVRAVVFGYACHCTAMGAVYEYNADWAGPAAEIIERGLPSGAVALFATGCGADLNPSPRSAGFDIPEKQGIQMAAAVLGVKPGLGNLRPIGGPLRTAYRVIDLPLEKGPPRELLEKGLSSSNVYRKRHSQEMLKLLDAGKLPSVVPLPLQAWRFGDHLTVVAIGGETCVDYALRLKHELGPDLTWVVGYANEVPCYIPSERVLAEGGYEAGWDLEFQRTLAGGSILYYGWPVPLAPGLEERIVRAVRDLAGR